LSNVGKFVEDMASQEHLTTIETALCELDAALNKE